MRCITLAGALPNYEGVVLRDRRGGCIDAVGTAGVSTARVVGYCLTSHNVSLSTHPRS